MIGTSILHAAKEDQRRRRCLPQREQRAEVRVGRNDNPLLPSRDFEYHSVAGGLATDISNMDRVVAGCAEASSEPGRQRVVDEELQAEATNGICLSQTVAAAYRSASPMSSG